MMRTPDPAADRSLRVVAQRGRATLVAGVWVLAIIGLAGLIVALVRASFTAQSTIGPTLAMVYAFIPLPFVVYLYWWLDRVEPEPRRYKFAAFVWGGVVVVAVVIGTQAVLDRLIDPSFETTVLIIAPITEEIAKGAFLLLTFLRLRHVIDGVVDGLVFAGIVALGFAFIENIGYYLAAFYGGFDHDYAGVGAATSVFVVRGITAPFAHPLFTSALGVALGLAIRRRSRTAKVAITVAGLLVSIGLHAAWNASAMLAEGRYFTVTYVALGLFLLGLGGYAAFARSLHLRDLRASLEDVAERGWIPAEEVPHLVGFKQRAAARRHARAEAGPSAEAVMRRYQSLATEMGFLHHVVESGQHKPRGTERIYELLDVMRHLRPAVRFPEIHGHRAHYHRHRA